MTIRCLPLLLVLALTAASSGTIRAAGTSHGLPAGSRVLVTRPLSGVAAQVVVYDSPGPHAAVLRTANSNRTVIWSIALHSATSAGLHTAGGLGSFQILVHSPSGVSLYVLRLAGSHVISALARSNTGLISSLERVAFTSTSFTTHARDTAHRGSVSYRLVTRYTWNAAKFSPLRTIRQPDYPAGTAPVPNGTVKTTAGNTILIRLEVAADEASRQQGLMNRTSLDPDSGMIFVWDAPTGESFWMENTYIPLTVAFLAPDGTVLEMQDMQPMTTTLHTPHEQYQYAIEANLGFFSQNGITVGDRFHLHFR